jgi:hypothetical protein
LGAGCIAQTIWNCDHGKARDSDILDYDLVYFDADDLSEESERDVAAEAARRVADLPVELDVTNEARVHLWNAARFGYSIQPYASTEDAIGTWPTTATAVGVRPSGRDVQIFAPFGLDDLLSLVVRPNRVQITPEIYLAKVTRWIRCWPKLTVLPWCDGISSPGSRSCASEHR